LPQGHNPPPGEGKKPFGGEEAFTRFVLELVTAIIFWAITVTTIYSVLK
jgi:hypothetical protein